MELVGRMFLCARCRERTVLCSRCDRGQIYCGRSCSSAARVEAQRAAGERYQSSDAGRIHHVERTRRWRLRKKDECAPIATHTDPVTHQGSPQAPTEAPVLPSSHLPDVVCLPAVDAAQTPWFCPGCAAAMPAASSIDGAPGHTCAWPERALQKVRHRSTLLPSTSKNRFLTVEYKRIHTIANSIGTCSASMS
jgi:hypothetical protein